MGNKGSSAAAQPQDYFGSIAGIACCGPVDWISGVLADQALIWPSAPVWPASATYVLSKKVAWDGTHVGIQTQQAHGLSVGQYFTTWNFDDASPYLNVTLGVVTLVNDAWGFEFAQPGSLAGTSAPESFTEGFVSPVMPFTSGTLTRVGPTVYTCTSNHSASLANQPGTAGGAAYWTQFRLDLTSASIPVEETEDSGTYQIVKLTTESHGELFIYRGTSTQTLDTTHENVLAPLGHPPYRDQVVIVLKNWFFGMEVATAPNVSVIVGRTPQQSVVTGASAALDPDGQANPICCLAELLTNPIWGLGLPSSVLDATSWQATADWVYGTSGANQGTFYISPLLDQPQNLRQLVSDLLDVCDCWVRWNNATGLIECGHWLHNQAAPSFTSGVNTVNYHDAVDGSEIGWDSNGWDDTFNKVTLHFLDRDHVWHTRPAIASAEWNRFASGRLKEQIVERPHVCRLPQAMTLASYQAKVVSEVGVSGKVTVRAETLTARPGDEIQVTHDAVSATLPCRFTSRTLKAPPAGQTEIEFESDRALSPQPYAPTPPGLLTSTQPLPASVALNYIDAGGTANSPATPNFTFIQLPPTATGGEDYGLTLLAGRVGNVTNAYDAYYLQADASTYKPLMRVKNFAVAAWVLGQKNTGTGVYTTTFPTWTTSVDDPILLNVAFNPFTPQADIDHVGGPLTADQIADNDLLCILVRNGSPNVYEICTVKQVQVSSDSGHQGTYLIQLVRGVFATLQGGDGSTAWAANDLAFLIWRSEIGAVTAGSFPVLAQAGSTMTLRIAPESAWYAESVGNVYDAGSNPTGLTIQTTYTWTDLFAPTISGWAVTVNGSAFSTGTNYLNTDQFTVTVSVSSRLAALASAQVLAVGGAPAPVPLLPNTLTVAGKASALLVCGPFTLAQGDWHLSASVTDATGRTTAADYTSSGSDVLIHIPATGSTPNAPVASPAGWYGAGSWPKSVTVTCSTGGSSCYYQITAQGVAYNPASWTLYTGAVNVAASQTLWAQSKLSGVYSAVVSWDFTYYSPSSGRGLTP